MGLSCLVAVDSGLVQREKPVPDQDGPSAFRCRPQVTLMDPRGIGCIGTEDIRGPEGRQVESGPLQAGATYPELYPTPGTALRHDGVTMGERPSWCLPKHLRRPVAVDRRATAVGRGHGRIGADGEHTPHDKRIIKHKKYRSRITATQYFLSNDFKTNKQKSRSQKQSLGNLIHLFLQGIPPIRVRSL